MQADDYPALPRAVAAERWPGAALTFDSPTAIAVKAWHANPGLSLLRWRRSTDRSSLVGNRCRRGYLQHLVVQESHRGQGRPGVAEVAIQALQAIGIDKSHLLGAGQQ